MVPENMSFDNNTHRPPMCRLLDVRTLGLRHSLVEPTDTRWSHEKTSHSWVVLPIQQSLPSPYNQTSSVSDNWGVVDQ